MPLNKDIINDLTSAMKEQDTDKVSVLRLIKSALLNAAKETGADELPDEEVTTVLQREAKKRKESIDAFSAGGRDDLVEKERAELSFIEKYLPEQLSDDDIKAAVQEVIDDIGEGEFGAIMGAAMKKLKGQADGNIVKEIVKKILTDK